MPPTADQLKSGDVLLYNTPGDLMDALITRTGPAAHVEFYEGAGKSLASRNGLGVARYDLRLEGLIGQLRLDADDNTISVFVTGFRKFFETVNGEAYDWQGLAGFIAGKDLEQPNHLFCSAFVALGALRAGEPLFNKDWPCGLITPSDFFKSAKLRWVWADTAQVAL